MWLWPAILVRGRYVWLSFFNRFLPCYSLFGQVLGDLPMPSVFNCRYDWLQLVLDGNFLMFSNRLELVLNFFRKLGFAHREGQLFRRKD